MSITLNFFEHSFNRGRRLQEAGKTKEAARLFDRLGLNAEIPNEIAAEALTSLGQLQLEQGQVEARTTMSEACRRDPFAAESHFLHAQACAQGDDADLDQAYGSLLSAVELEPEVASFRAELGKIQIALGMEEEGIGSLELAVELEPNNPGLLRDLVDALMDLGRESEAREVARAALFSFPRIQGFRSLWNDLCFCLAADEIGIAADQARASSPGIEAAHSPIRTARDSQCHRSRWATAHPPGWAVRAHAAFIDPVLEDGSPPGISDFWLMMDAVLTRCLRRLGAPPCLRVYGKARRETAWRSIDVVATARRNRGSGWPLMHGTCITWTSAVIVVGWDFARGFLAEQIRDPANRDRPTEVLSGRLADEQRRVEAGAPSQCSYSEIMAHECGHTAQAIRLDSAYLPLVGSVTLFREGNHWWNHWENDASEQGLMGGIAEVVRPIELWPIE